MKNIALIKEKLWKDISERTLLERSFRCFLADMEASLDMQMFPEL